MRTTVWTRRRADQPDLGLPTRHQPLGRQEPVAVGSDFLKRAALGDHDRVDGVLTDAAEAQCMGTVGGRGETRHVLATQADQARAHTCDAGRASARPGDTVVPRHGARWTERQLANRAEPPDDTHGWLHDHRFGILHQQRLANKWPVGAATQAGC